MFFIPYEDYYTAVSVPKTSFKSYTHVAKGDHLYNYIFMSEMNQTL